MNRNLLSPLCLRLLLPAAAITAAGACSDPFSLGPATIENRIDTVLIVSVSAAALGQPNGYDIIQRSVAVTELGQSFDFVFDIRDGNAVLLPTAALGIRGRAGIRIVNKTFDELIKAPDSGYTTDMPVVVNVGDVFAARSRRSSTGCSFLGSISRFGKFEVLSIDAVAQGISLKVLINSNCGFNDLEPGLPRK